MRSQQRYQSQQSDEDVEDLQPVVKEPELPNCITCHQPVVTDGYGEVVHYDTGQYSCDPYTKNEPNYRFARVR